jgi:hypothetical protein
MPVLEPAEDQKDWREGCGTSPIPVPSAPIVVFVAENMFARHSSPSALLVIGIRKD